MSPDDDELADDAPVDEAALAQERAAAEQSEDLPRSMGLTLRTLRVASVAGAKWQTDKDDGEHTLHDLAEALNSTPGRTKSGAIFSYEMVSNLEKSEYLYVWQIARYANWCGLPVSAIMLVQELAAHFRDADEGLARSIAEAVRTVCEHALGRSSHLAGRHPGRRVKDAKEKFIAEMKYRRPDWTPKDTRLALIADELLSAYPSTAMKAKRLAAYERFAKSSPRSANDMEKIPAKERLIVALDVPTTEAAMEIVRRLGSSCGFYKVGLELLMSGGLDLVRSLKGDGKKVFLDMKLLDIETTVERATANAAKLGADFLTLHGLDRKTMDAAVRGRGDSTMKLLAVTVLTNLSHADLQQQGISHKMKPAELVVHRAQLAVASGIDGVVASGLEATAIRAEVGSKLTIVTPGIRLPSDRKDDQTRSVTPTEAIRAGANYLVIGRPITQAEDPKAVAETINSEIEAAATATVKKTGRKSSR